MTQSNTRIARELVDNGPGQVIVAHEDQLRFELAPAPRRGMHSAFLAGPDAGLPYSIHATFAEPGGGIPPHIHPKYAEGVYVISGRVRITIGDQQIEAGAGCWFLGRPNAAIGWENIGQERAHVLAIFSPPLAEPDQLWLEDER